MTAAQQARTEGFLASLAVRGVSLSFGASSVVSLVQPWQPDGGEFNLGKGERVMSAVRMLRTECSPHMASRALIPGTSLADPDGNRHRIAEVVDNPTDVAVTFVCETSKPS